MNDTIAVGVELWSAGARRLILHAASLAAQMGAAWTAIVVSDAAHALDRLSDDERQRLRQNTDLVASLGGRSYFCDGSDVAATLVAAAGMQGARLLILGKPRRRGMVGRFFGGEVADSLMHLPSALALIFVESQ